MVVAVAIAIILITGTLWLFAAHPGALRAAVDGFDANYADARALAAKTGNGATIVFAPRKDASGGTIPGFTMRVYAGQMTGMAGASGGAFLLPLLLGITLISFLLALLIGVAPTEAEIRADADHLRDHAPAEERRAAKGSQ